MKIIRTRVEAETMREALDESGCWWSDKAMMAATSVAIERLMRSTPMLAEAYFSILDKSYKVICKLNC